MLKPGALSSNSKAHFMRFYAIAILYVPSLFDWVSPVFHMGVVQEHMIAFTSSRSTGHIHKTCPKGVVAEISTLKSCERSAKDVSGYTTAY